MSRQLDSLVSSGGRLDRSPQHPVGCYLFWAMQPLKARVLRGRLVLNEPTDLPEGEEVELVPVEEVLARGGDYLDEEERERLHESLRESIEQAKRGETIDADEAMAEIRARR